ncbi:NAD(P)/FAD-dependent oxidoreductase [Acinetobacter zhairhuonensis]|uniref:flavoprotein n=1 Tax=Acinetobacter sp. A7.4 TaxID=2919921 RepID=UPI001F4F563D|nr:flavoprotein [Acinetobacter sp. A7.4]MCJ8162271.1 flavoprotein [Acinetobacter sp. A7.4]
MQQQSKLNISSHIFQHRAQDYAAFTGQLFTSKQFSPELAIEKNIAIIGLDQKIVASLEKLRKIAKSIQVFQIQPAFILPQSEMKYSRAVQHPLLMKNKRLLNTRIKSILALRFLDHQIQDNWLKRQLTPNIALENKVFLKSDDYYHALQQANCQLITWPIKKITSNTIECVDGSIFPVDLIITSAMHTT